VRLLLDTHVLLWALVGSTRIKRIAGRLQSDDNEVYFSVASLWEIAIKSGISKLGYKTDEVRNAALASGFLELPVLGAHVEALTRLPDHHRDPFDRLLVAQAASEPMILLTADDKVAKYGHHIELV